MEIFFGKNTRNWKELCVKKLESTAIYGLVEKEGLWIMLVSIVAPALCPESTKHIQYTQIILFF